MPLVGSILNGLFGEDIWNELRVVERFWSERQGGMKNDPQSTAADLVEDACFFGLCDTVQYTRRSMEGTTKEGQSPGLVRYTADS